MTAIGRATGPRIGSSSSLAADSSGFGGRVDIGIVCAEQTCCIPWPLSPKSPFLPPSTTASPATSSSISALMAANSSTRQASSSPSPLSFFFPASSSSHYQKTCRSRRCPNPLPAILVCQLDEALWRRGRSLFSFSSLACSFFTRTSAWVPSSSRPSFKNPPCACVISSTCTTCCSRGPLTMAPAPLSTAPCSTLTRCSTTSKKRSWSRKCRSSSGLPLMSTSSFPMARSSTIFKCSVSSSTQMPAPGHGATSMMRMLLFLSLWPHSKPVQTPDTCLCTLPDPDCCMCRYPPHASASRHISAVGSLVGSV